MSVDSYLRAFEWRDGTSIQLHVLLAIGCTQERDSNLAKITLESLADLTGYCRATVAKVVRHWIEVEALERRGTRGRNANEYRYSAGRDGLATVHLGETFAGCSTVYEPSTNRLRTVYAEQHFSGPLGGRGKGVQIPPYPPSAPRTVCAVVLPGTAPVGAGKTALAEAETSPR